MKKTTFYLSILGLLFFTWNGVAQTLNQNASWPNASWDVTGTYNPDPTAFEADPRVTANFAFDDDDAGNPSTDDIAAESPVIDLTAAFGAGETWLTVNTDYIYRQLGDVLTLEYWDADASSWMPWSNIAGNATAPSDDFCTGVRTTFTSTPLDITGFTGTQQSGFRYRLYFNDNAGWVWGFCFDSPTITSAAPPACIPATFTLSNGSNNCPTEEFFIDVDITALGSASLVDITNDGGAPAITGVDGSATPYSVGPFPAGTTVNIVVADNADVTCNDTDSLTTLGSCPPDCATNPVPSSGAIDVAVGPITLSWTAPASGPAPDSYNVYVADDIAGTNPALLGNYVATDTGSDIAVNAYNVDVFWFVLPEAGGVEAPVCNVWTFTTESPSGTECLTAPFGQWPTATYDVAASATCDGTTVNDITTCGYNGEYSLVAVVAGENYRFQSSVSTDFVTIGSEDGTSAYIGSRGYVIWTSTVTGIVRFYTHVDNQCGSLDECRTRSVICGATLSTEDFDTNGDLFSYYPNPVTNTLTLNAQNDIQNVVVFNMLGQQVMRTAPNAVNSEVDMTTLNPGAYFVQVTINNTTETIRVIKN